MKPRISIIMPVYNAECYIKRTIDCLMRQSFSDFEVLIIEDKSTDHSKELLIKHIGEDKRFIVKQNDENIGCAESRNRGLSVAKGDYILCLDADDTFCENLLERLYEVAVRETADVVVCKSLVIDKLTNNQRYFGQWKRIGLSNDYYGKCLRIDDPINYPNICELIDYVAWNKMLKRDYFLDNELWFPNINYYEDIPFSFLSCLNARRLVFLNEELIQYYMHQAPWSMTSWKVPKEYNMLKAFDLIIQEFESSIYEDIRIDIINRAMKNIYSIVTSKRTISADKKQIIDLFTNKYMVEWEIVKMCEKNLLSEAGKKMMSYCETHGF